MTIVSSELQSHLPRTERFFGFAPEFSHLSNGSLHLYSGQELTQRGANPGSWHGVFIHAPKGIDITMMMRLSPRHHAMDAISIFTADNGLISWVKSDGVTRIPSEINYSAQLSDWLSRQGGNSAMQHDPQSRAKEISAMLNQLSKPGYATFEFGTIFPTELGWSLQAFRVGSTRANKERGYSGGDYGTTEYYYQNDKPDEYNELYDPSISKSFVGQDNLQGSYLTKKFSGAEPLTITTATDGVIAVGLAHNRGWQSSGMVIERSISTAAKANKQQAMTQKLLEDGYINATDDLSLLSIHLPSISS